MSYRHRMQQEQQKRVNIERGQNILVQVTREPVGNKGVRVTTRVSIPGRFIVLMPFDGRIGVSRKIANVRERKRLRRLVRSLIPKGFGAIIRTVAENKDEGVLKQDIQQLNDTFRDIEQKSKGEQTSKLVFKELSISTSVIRDLFTADVDKVYTDSKKLFKDIQRYVSWAAPNLVEKVQLYDGKEPIFDKFGIEQEIETTLSRKVPLPSGGYIIVENTEAMVVIDVNSGRYAAKSDQELNSLRTNLEAAREIARQVRLRDLGGILVVDFIDMHEERNRKKVYDEAKKEFKRDRARSTMLPISEFGLLQVTRQRMRQTLLHSVSEPCPSCAGTGMVQSKHTILSTIERWIRRARMTLRERRFILEVNPLMVDNLTEGFISPLRRMQLKYGMLLKLQPDEDLGADEFRLFSVKQQKDVTDQLR
jgi:ribonuclease G